MMKKYTDNIFSISFAEIGKVAVPAKDFNKNETKPAKSRTKIGKKKKV